MPVSASPSRGLAAPLSAGAAGDAFSRFDELTTEPTSSRWTDLRFKLDFDRMRRQLATLPTSPVETVDAQLAMTKALYRAINHESRQIFKRLLQQGVLSDLSDENHHSALYHLHQRLTQPAISGYDRVELVQMMLRLLDRPYMVSQKPPALSPNYATAMLEVEKNPVVIGNLRKTVYVQRPQSKQSLNIQSTFDCTASAVMFGMLEQQPSEIIRQLNGLTSPQRQFTKLVNLADLNPTDPEAAIKRLKQQHVPFEPLGGGKIRIRVTAPEQVVIRSLNDAVKQKGNMRNRDALQTLYEMTLVELADPNGYDEADGRMVAPDGSNPGEGLPGDLIDMMSSLIEGRGGTGSVTVQQMDARPHDPEQRPYLMGYTLPFDYTQSLLVQALKKGVMPMVGIVYLDDDGGFEGGHYIRLAGTYVDPKTRERHFVIADSDDGLPTTVTMSARKLIPMINRLHLSAVDATETNRLMEQLASKNQVFITDEADAQKYDVLPIYQYPATNQPNTGAPSNPGSPAFKPLEPTQKR